ncbi:hypothetical protein LC087_18455 [Bacillus carboniphilus]|uniref:Uncharacterized protein n=1 Tax=Bacillus carboniphilus TaxID=86663 RepID=A0ABY9JTC7_9BACI|nr:hypothetical protein [Bacillus carboniphilus]WLR42634.1 hypothetical protein LC087_18455 [Bacillus carboniphilus]
MEFVQRGDFNYYEKLKACYAESEWPDVLEGLLFVLEKNHQEYTYTSILMEEERHRELLEYCRGNVDKVAQFASFLVNDFKEEVQELYEQSILKEAERSKNRSNYRQVCRSIRDYKSIFGKKSVQVLVERLKKKYTRRPAFIDELGKVS